MGDISTLGQVKRYCKSKAGKFPQKRLRIWRRQVFHVGRGNDKHSFIYRNWQTVIIRGLKESSSLKETKAKQEKQKRDFGKTETVKGIRGKNYNIVSSESKTLDCHHNKAKCDKKGTNQQIHVRGTSLPTQHCQLVLNRKRNPILLEAVRCPAKNIFQTPLKIMVTDEK